MSGMTKTQVSGVGGLVTYQVAFIALYQKGRYFRLGCYPEERRNGLTFLVPFGPLTKWLAGKWISAFAQILMVVHAWRIAARLRNDFRSDARVGICIRKVEQVPVACQLVKNLRLFGVDRARMYFVPFPGVGCKEVQELAYQHAVFIQTEVAV